jgi:hypothetical protein
MVLIFGWGQSEASDLGEVAPARCPRCHNVVGLHHVRTKKSVSLYFVPVVPYGGDEYLLCPICRNGIQLAPEQKAPVADMTHATAAFRHGVMRQEAYEQRVLAFWAQMGHAAFAPHGGVVTQAVSGPTPSAPLAGQVPRSALPALPVGDAPTVAGRSTSKQLGDLARLHSDGVLTEEEYCAAVKRILDV